MKKYNQAQAPIGSTLSGEFLRAMGGRNWVDIHFIEMDGKTYELQSDIQYMLDSINDKDIFAVLVNSNSDQVYFVQLHTRARVSIYLNEVSGRGALYEDSF